MTIHGRALHFLGTGLLMSLAWYAGASGDIRGDSTAQKRTRSYLWGTWYVRCPDGHVDKVEDATAQHVCEDDKCKKQCFIDGKVTVMCPDNHTNEIAVRGRVEGRKCKTDGCKKECRRHDEE